MKENRAQVIRWIGLSEGGYVNHPKDPGGATDRGITQRTYSAWLRMQGRSDRTVRGIGKAEADQIIYEQYLKPVMFDDLPSGVDYALADYAVNSGPAKAVKDLQRVVGATADGIMGAQTLAAVLARNPATVVKDLCNRRMEFLRSLGTWRTFGKGWTARVVGRVDGIQIGDVGVIDRATMMANQRATIPDPRPQVVAKAPPPEPARTVGGDDEAKGALMGVGGAVAASGGVLSALGALDPAAQVAAVSGLVVALAALLWIFRKRLARMAE